ncbi:MAG: hypothetical protein ACI9VR_005010 [Cognaticolwellia sp.]|jgi:hypothetical protein
MDHLDFSLPGLGKVGFTQPKMRDGAGFFMLRQHRDLEFQGLLELLAWTDIPDAVSARPVMDQPGRFASFLEARNASLWFAHQAGGILYSCPHCGHRRAIYGSSYAETLRVKIPQWLDRNVFLEALQMGVGLKRGSRPKGVMGAKLEVMLPSDKLGVPVVPVHDKLLPEALDSRSAATKAYPKWWLCGARAVHASSLSLQENLEQTLERAVGDLLALDALQWLLTTPALRASHCIECRGRFVLGHL